MSGKPCLYEDTQLGWRNGRRVRLRGAWGNLWGFESPPEHQSCGSLTGAGRALQLSLKRGITDDFFTATLAEWLKNGTRGRGHETSNSRSALVPARCWSLNVSRHRSLFRNICQCSSSICEKTPQCWHPGAAGRRILPLAPVSFLWSAPRKHRLDVIPAANFLLTPDFPFYR